MKILKVIGILLAVYVGIVVVFESWLGYSQPESDNTIIITTTDADGNQADRVVTAIDDGDKLYIAANHWPRAWFRAVQANPAVVITRDGESQPYVAVPVSDTEHVRLDTEVRPLPLMMRFLTGFPPRYFVRMDPA